MRSKKDILTADYIFLMKNEESKYFLRIKKTPAVKLECSEMCYVN
jgi:hypothetical protein